MKIAVRKRNTLLSPPSNDDIDWIASILDDPEIWLQFGFPGPAGRRFRHYYKRKRALIAATISTISPMKRVGFTIMFPPADLGCWEFAYVIPEASDRNLFTALNSTDIMAHYMFDHLGIDAIGWRTREGNNRADAVIRRLGYAPAETREMDDATYTFYQLDRAGWAKRLEKLGNVFTGVEPSQGRLRSASFPRKTTLSSDSCPSCPSPTGSPTATSLFSKRPFSSETNMGRRSASAVK